MSAWILTEKLKYIQHLTTKNLDYGTILAFGVSSPKFDCLATCQLTAPNLFHSKLLAQYQIKEDICRKLTKNFVTTPDMKSFYTFQ